MQDRYSTNGYAALTLQAQADPGRTYTANSSHEVVIYYYDYELPYTYYDYYNFDYFSYTSINEPFYYNFFGPGPLVVRNRSDVYLGATYDSASVTTPKEADHLQIVDDEFNTLPCDRLERSITYRIVDIKNNPVFNANPGNFIRESDSSVVDSCSGQIPQYDSSCGGHPGSIFVDHLSAACPANGDYDCGFDIPDEQWLSCRANGALVPLATLDYNIRHARIIVSGYSGKLPKGYFVRRNRSILPN
ncbi:MAG: hypothetical protein ABR577_13070 [Pyrinomonadaceae bacterium]